VAREVVLIFIDHTPWERDWFKSSAGGNSLRYARHLLKGNHSLNIRFVRPIISLLVPAGTLGMKRTVHTPQWPLCVASSILLLWAVN